MKDSFYSFDTRIGALTVTEKSGFINGLYFGRLNPKGYENGKTELIETCIAQIEEYLRGDRREFQLPLLMEGTDFRKTVWEALKTIPYGETRSYKDIAIQIGKPKAMRAVGGANHHNPVSIIVP